MLGLLGYFALFGAGTIFGVMLMCILRSGQDD